MSNILKLFATTQNKINLLQISKDIFSYAFSEHEVMFFRFGVDFSSIILEADLQATSDLINTFTLSSLNDIAARSGLAMCSIEPCKNGIVQFSIRKDLFGINWSNEELIAATTSFITAHQTIVAYLNKLDSDLNLDVVDVSMFEEINLDSTDLTDFVLRRYLVYPSWNDFTNFILDEADLTDENRAEVLDLITACEMFEELNPHLKLPAVVSEVEDLVHKIKDDQHKFISDKEIN